MKFKLIFFLLLNSALVLAQVQTHPGGGLPSDHSKLEECQNYEADAIGKEKAFVLSYKQKYNTEDDFTALIAKMLLSKQLKVLEQKNTVGEVEFRCTDKSISLLEEILLVYEVASDVNMCPMFSKRVKQIPTLKKVIQLYGK